jgi:hypothetical protein
MAWYNSISYYTSLWEVKSGNVVDVHIAEKQPVARGEKLLVIEY